MFNGMNDRRSQLQTFFLIVSILLIVKLAIITIVDGDYYREMSQNKRLKKIPLVAKRGEIIDRNGVVLAGNTTAFTVQLISSELPTKEFSAVALKIINILDDKKEAHIEFPIRLRGNQKYYPMDEEMNAWLVSNGYTTGTTAKQVFKQIREQESIAPDLDDYSAQKFLIMKGINPPVMVKNMKFSMEIEKKKFLDLYGLPENTPADSAFAQIRTKLKIPASYSDADAYKAMVLCHALKEKGYRKYEPIKIANSIHKETAILIEEMGMDLPGIKVEVEPVRTYPFGDLAAHVIGYMGKIATEKEYDTYVAGKGYLMGDLIGKTGIEGSLESQLRGTNGSKYIEVDAYGRQVREVVRDIDGVEAAPPKSGKNVQLTIDSNLQKVASDSLAKALAAIRTGGYYESPWGRYSFGKAYSKAETGAVVAVDVNTGEVLALANYPSFNLNLFATGIKPEDWAALQPQNPKDPLAPRPLYNLAAMSAVQPGSTFKMVTGFAALEEGFSPYNLLMDGGVIKTADGTTRACWIWNKSRGTHGLINMPHALEVSCNYYFFDVANGYDYYADHPLGIKMNATKLVEYARKFGLNDPTGVEIGEAAVGVPDPNKKKKDLLLALRVKMLEVGPNYFPKTVIDNEEQFDSLMKKINGLADLNLGRRALTRKLIELGANKDETVTEGLADIIKFSFFNQMKWAEGDTFNLAIGQGSNAYTPLQMARYISAVANDGYLYNLTLIKSIDGKTPERKKPVFINPHDNMKYLREGMYLVAHGEKGTSRTAFHNFPIHVGVKTGTAEKDGKLPAQDEEAYIKQYFRWIAPRLSYSNVENEAARILAERNEEVAALEKKLQATTDPAAKAKMEQDVLAYFNNDMLSKAAALREAIKVLSNHTIKDEAIDRYKQGFDDFTWFVSFAPYEKPEIAVVVFIPQGGGAGFAGPIVKDICAQYFKMTPGTTTPSAATKVESNEGLR